MKKLLIVLKFELLRYFTSPLAYVYLMAFLLLNGACAFYFGHFFERGQASLSPMFWYQPWLYLLFTSGIAMRLWAEEFRTKTVVQIMTMPVSTQTLVWGKFLASWLFTALALALTFPFWLTVNFLGAPDNNVILAGYFGSLILAGAMLAVGQTMSALTKNQIIALVLAVAANLFFFWSGIEFVLAFFRLFLPDYLIDTIASFSFLTHFYNMSAGLIELRDLLYFGSVIVLFNFTSVLVVSFKTSGTASWLHSTNRLYYILAWSALVVGFMGLNLIFNNLTRGVSLDTTEEKIYTLNTATKNILKNIPEKVTAKLYFSDILEQRNPAMRQMFDKVRLLLEQYKSQSDGRFEYRIYHPQSLDYVEDRALGDGLQPIPLIDLNQNALFGLTLTDTLNNKKVIPMFMPERMGFLEQDLTALLYQLSRQKKTVGLISGLPINGEGGSESMVYQPWAISEKVGEFYQLKTITKAADFEPRPDALWIIHPQFLDEGLIEAIQNYSRDYGKILLLLDGAPEAPRLYSSMNLPLNPSDLSGLDAFWGFRYYPEYVVADLENSITVDATQNYNTNPNFTQDVIQFKLKNQNFNPSVPIVSHLKNMLFSSASIILPLANAPIRFVPLIQAGGESALMNMDVVYNGLNPRQILTYFQPDQNPKILAAYIEGKTNENPFQLIAVGDTDFIYDNFWTAPVQVMDKTYFMPLFNNADFILNALDYLTNDEGLISLRGKSDRDRSFEGIEKMRKHNLFEFKLKEEEILNRIENAKNQLQEVWNKKDFEERETFNADELSLIANIRKELNALRQQLADIRTISNRNIEALSFKLKFLNIFALPLGISLLVGVMYVLRTKRRKEKLAGFKLNKRLCGLLFAAVLIFGIGMLSVYISNRSALEAYEGKLLLPDLAQKINDVKKIVIQTHTQKLTFKLNDNGVWILEEMPLMTVYQERIRSFLSTLLSARFYEQKSDKAENLFRFGLAPIETENSPNVRLELYDENNQNIQNLEVGDYKIDLGRGDMAAYVKFDNRFQVWLAQADFVDLDTDFKPWTYSSLWNLRFGRFADINGQTESNDLLNTAKYLLNTTFVSARQNLQNKKSVGRLEIRNEDNDLTTINFYEAQNKIYATYRFEEPVQNNYLAFFAHQSDGVYFEVDDKQWESIKNGIKLKK